MDHGAKDGGRATSGGAVHQDRGEEDGGAAHQTPGCLPPDRGHSGHVSGPSTRALPCGHCQRYGDRGGWTTLQRGRDGGGGLGEPPALAPEFQSGEWGAAADCCRICRVVRQQAAPMGRLPNYDERPVYCTVQAAMGQAGRGWVNLVADDG